MSQTLCLVQRQDEAGKTEHGAVIVLWVGTVDVGADMTEFVQISNIGHSKSGSPKCTKTRAGAQASE